MKTIWCNGTFDVLHPGHVELFKVAKSLGDKLVVAIDSDEKIKRDKGADRPINSLESRKAILEAIKYIDIVIVFNTAKELAGLILDRSSGDARAALCLEDTFDKESDWYIERAGQIVNKVPRFKLAAKLEGQVRQTGIHAAAVVVSEKPLVEISGFARGKEKEKILCLDKFGAESLGLLKIDMLGLKQLAVFELIFPK